MKKRGLTHASPRSLPSRGGSMLRMGVWLSMEVRYRDAAL